MRMSRRSKDGKDGADRVTGNLTTFRSHLPSNDPDEVTGGQFTNDVVHVHGRLHRGRPLLSRRGNFPKHFRSRPRVDAPQLFSLYFIRFSLVAVEARVDAFVWLLRNKCNEVDWCAPCTVR